MKTTTAEPAIHDSYSRGKRDAFEELMDALTSEHLLRTDDLLIIEATIERNRSITEMARQTVIMLDDPRSDAHRILRRYIAAQVALSMPLIWNAPSLFGDGRWHDRLVALVWVGGMMAVRTWIELLDGANFRRAWQRLFHRKDGR